LCPDAALSGNCAGLRCAKEKAFFQHGAVGIREVAQLLHVFLVKLQKFCNSCKIEHVESIFIRLCCLLIMKKVKPWEQGSF